MPKELTHWYLATRCADRLARARALTTEPSGTTVPDGSVVPDGSGSTLGEVLARNLSVYLIGAVAPDLLYYAKDASRYRDAADRAHGVNGENSYGFLSRLLPRQAIRGEAGRSREWVPAGAGGNENVARFEQTFALACGILTHIAADAIFHPLVYFYCGYSHGDHPEAEDPPEATTRHWVFETCIDRYVRGMTKSAEERSFEERTLSALIGSRNVEKEQLFRDLSLFFFGESEAHRNVMEATFRRHARFQRLFESRAAAMAVRVAARFQPRLSWFLGLSYPAQRGRSLDMLDGNIEYNHPATCERQYATFGGLAERAVDTAIERMTALWAATVERTPEEDLTTWRGPSLETGLVIESGAAVEMVCTRPDLFDSFFPFRTEKHR